MRRTTLRTLPLFAAVLIATACERSAGPLDAVQSVALASALDSLDIAQTVQLHVSALDAEGYEIAGRRFTFSSDDTTIASVSATGLVRAVGPGTTVLRARVGRVSGTRSITVRPPACVAGSGVVSAVRPFSTSGSFSDRDCIFDGLGPAKGYRFALTEITVLRARLHSAGNNVTVMVGPDGGRVISYFSDAPGDTTYSLTQLGPGPVDIWVVAQAGGVGPFTFTVADVTVCPEAVGIPSIAEQSTVNGTITSSSCINPLNSRESALFAFTVENDSPVRFSARAVGFRPEIILWSKGFIYGVAEAVGSDSTDIKMRLPVGSYEAMVTSIGGGLGSFSLTRSVGEFVACVVPSTSLAIPSAVSSSLEIEDCADDYGARLEPYLLTVPTEQYLELNLTSERFDPILEVYSLDRTFRRRDDDGGEGLNSRVRTLFPAGSYIIEVRGYMGNVRIPFPRGPYSLTVTPVSGLQAPGIERR